MLEKIYVSEMAERKGRLQQVICYRNGEDTGILILKEMGERQGFIVRLRVSLDGVTCTFLGNVCWSCHLG